MAGLTSVSNVPSNQRSCVRIVQGVSAIHDLKGYKRLFVSDIVSKTKPDDLSNLYVEGEDFDDIWDL